MKKNKFTVFFVLLLFVSTFSCKKKDSNQDEPINYYTELNSLNDFYNTHSLKHSSKACSVKEEVKSCSLFIHHIGLN